MYPRRAVFYFFSKILDVLLSPLAWAILLCLYAARRRRHARGRRARRWPALTAALVLYVFSIEPVANALTASLETPDTNTARDGVTYDAVALLGGVVDDRATFTHRQPSYNENIERLLVTFDLLRTGRAKVAVVSGGPVDGSRAEVVEAHVLGKQLVDWGIAPDRIVIEDQARNTRENAVYVAKIAREHGWSAIVVVTSAFHVPRALDCFRAVSLRVDALPVDYKSYDVRRFSSSWLPRAAFLGDSTRAIREIAGRAIYRAQGYGR
jgi:uncharacterized SAM-binding protein YcdF (DUF218 family)